MTEASVEITARCLCKKHVFTTMVGKALLPLKAAVCHCNSCRHMLGGLYLAVIPWPNHEEDVSGLKHYEFSSNISQFSCSVCSSQLFSREKHMLYVCTGALDNIPGLVTYEYHMFVGDTKDGGFSSWLLKSPDGSPITRWRGRSEKSEQLPISWPGGSISTNASREKAAEAAAPDMTPLWCHCRGVSLTLRSGLDVASETSKKGLSMSQPPRLGTGKYCSSIDACDSCRLATGTDFIHWAFAPVDHLCLANESSSSSLGLSTIGELREAVDARDARLGTLCRYRSSPTVDRYHCGNCSATIFYTRHSLPDQVDIAVGVLEHPDGARAEGLLEWKTSDIDHQQDTKGGWRAGLVNKVLEGCRASLQG